MFHYSSLVIFSLTSMIRELIGFIECPRTWNFFKGMTYLHQALDDHMD